MDSLSTALRRTAESHPGHAAIVEDGRRLSYGSLAAATGDLAARLRAAGAGPGATVGVLLPNGSAFARAFFAVAHVGGAVLPLNPALREPELAALLGDADAALVVAAGELRDRAASVLASLRRDGGHVLAVDGLADPLPAPAAAWPAPAGSADAPFLYLYSSGSTGRPKRIARSQTQLLSEVGRLVSALGLSRDDRVLGVAPFSHVNGLTRSMIAGLLSGATLVPLPQFERRLVGRTIHEQAITVFTGVPFMFAMLAETRWPGPIDFSSLRLCISSSAPLPPEVAARFRERYGRPIRQLYGCTETGSIAVDLGPESELADDCVGRPLEGVEVDLFTETRRPVADGEAGEIGIRSPSAATEYAGLPEQTRESFWNGYFFPGDIGRKDASGRVYLIGRKSLFINRGGYKVNPYELEAVIRRHPKVREVAVVGVDTPYGDQKVKAVVVPASPCDELEIIDFCRESVADFKVPSIVEFRTELPTSSTGKLLRKGL